MGQPKSVVINGYDIVAAEVPPRRRGRGGGRPPLAKTVLAAMDELGVDSVRVQVGAANRSRMSVVNASARRHGIPVKFLARNLHIEDGREIFDIYAVRVQP